MTVVSTTYNERVWRCDVCGHENVWGNGWQWYGSLLHADVCLTDLLTACSDECAEKMREKIGSGEWRLPRIAGLQWGRPRIERPRKGY